MEALPLPSTRRVQFANINDKIERQKIQKRSTNNLLKKQKKEARKMAAETRNEKVRYFLEFLQSTRDLNQLRREISGSNVAMAHVTLMFPQIRNNNNNQAEWLTAFCNVVSSLQLPVGKKREHESQMLQLEALVDFWTQQGLYDNSLDPFLQYLRERIGQGNLTEVILGTLAEPNREVAREVVEATERGLLATGPIGRIPAVQLSPALQTILRELKGILTQGGAYRYGGLAIPSASSGESSDADEEGVYEI